MLFTFPPTKLKCTYKYEHYVLPHSASQLATRANKKNLAVKHFMLLNPIHRILKLPCRNTIHYSTMHVTSIANPFQKTPRM